MLRPRVSLSGLIVCVLACGLGLAALRNASPTWAGSILLLTLGLLVVAVLGVVYRREERRAWWLGFALYGWGFAALVLAPWSQPQALPNAMLLDRLYPRVSPTKLVAIKEGTEPPDVRIGDALVVSNDVLKQAIPLPYGPADRVYPFLDGTLRVGAFRSIGNCLLTLLVACVGGVVARWFHATRGPTSTHAG